jgi:hypothetical protein
MANKQVSISSFFTSKTGSTPSERPIDLTNENEEQPHPPLKRRRTNESKRVSRAKGKTNQRKGAGSASFAQTRSEKSNEPTSTRAQKIRKTLHLSPSPSSRAASVDSSSDSAEENSNRLKQLANSFENKGGRKIKGKGKAEEHIGPSGQSWTPLELQVS